jgi:hypothetical protein
MREAVCEVASNGTLQPFNTRKHKAKGTANGGKR